MCDHNTILDRLTTEWYCSLCGEVRSKPMLFENDRFGPLPMPILNPQYAPVRHFYRRITRFREKIRLLSGESDVFIPPYVMKTLRSEHKRRNIATPSVKSVLFILKRAGHPKYMESVRQILHALDTDGSINSRSLCITFTEDERSALDRRFYKCDDAWPRIKSDLYTKYKLPRITFISYIYLIYNFLILDCVYDKAALLVPLLLKTDDLLHRQQLIWRQFCKALDWEFIPIIGNALSSKEAVSNPHTIHLDIGKKPRCTRRLHEIIPGCRKYETTPREKRHKRLRAKYSQSNPKHRQSPCPTI